MAANGLSGRMLYTWYLIIGLPGLVVVLASGMVGMSCLMASSRGMGAAGSLAIIGVAACGLFGWATHHQRAVLRAVPIDPRREAALVCHPTLNPFDPHLDDVVTAGIGQGSYLDLAYNPGAIPVKNAEEIRAVADLATRSGRPLYFCCGCMGLAIERFPEAFDLLEKSGEFERVATLYGVDEERRTTVYRYKAPVQLIVNQGEGGSASQYRKSPSRRTRLFRHEKSTGSQQHRQ